MVQTYLIEGIHLWIIGMKAMTIFRWQTDYTESAMTEEDGKIIVTTRRPLISADGGEPEYDTQVYTYVVTEFQDIYGNPVSFRQCVSVDYPT